MIFQKKSPGGQIKNRIPPKIELERDFMPIHTHNDICNMKMIGQKAARALTRKSLRTHAHTHERQTTAQGAKYSIFKMHFIRLKLWNCL